MKIGFREGFSLYIIYNRKFSKMCNNVLKRNLFYRQEEGQFL